MLSHKSFVAALKAAGSVCKAVDEILDGKVSRANVGGCAGVEHVCCLWRGRGEVV